MTDHETRSSEADTLRELTTRIVTAYVSSNTVPADTLPGLIATVFQALGGPGQATTGTPDLVPAVPVRWGGCRPPRTASQCARMVVGRNDCA
ncbi:MucR family transcriptional regulator, partial [Komagataeibacter xylinus]|uniref:MucR family transcriptional regulator n=1 Tax=Komagataeibacter xylinus TaxID=28448 RepID=UPI001F5F1E5F